MDLNAKIESAREEYQQVDFQLNALEGQRERELLQYENNREILSIRKHQLEGKLAAFVDLLTEQGEEQDTAAYLHRAADLQGGLADLNKQEITTDA